MIWSIQSNTKPQQLVKEAFAFKASRNLCDGSGLKIDSNSTSVVWCGEGPSAAIHSLFIFYTETTYWTEYNNKVLTSTRNGEVIMWDINKSGSKYERKLKDHIRSIHALSSSGVVSNYFIIRSSHGDLRVRDLREFQKSIMRVRRPTGIRTIVFSLVVWSLLQAVVRLDNGSIYRWDLEMRQWGSLDRIMIAHSASVTCLDMAMVGSQRIPYTHPSKPGASSGDPYTNAKLL
ncbi:MAG: hypothetical protein NXY57DRAFT_961230 [Lentinula lateritia]|nr:MAG: hypothetical protein NXY57DRAFT_961230 [Lentinula lateritia]